VDQVATGETTAPADALPPPPSPALPAPPPPTPAPPASWRHPVAGQLTIGWRIATGIAWGLVLVSFVAVWKTSTELGLTTWWLGPMGDPNPFFVTMLPFVAPLVMLLLVVNNFRWLPYAGLAASALIAVIGAFDFAKVTRLAIVEVAIAAAGALTSVAGFAGRYRA
jgi:hypothetical protein